MAKQPFDDDEDEDDRPVRRPKSSRDDEDEDDRPSRRPRNSRDAEDDYDDAPRRPKQKEGQGLAMASMIVGIISIPFACCCGIFSLPASVAAIIMGFIAKSKTGGDSQSTTGLITGFIALLLAVVLLILGLLDVFKFDPRQFQNN